MHACDRELFKGQIQTFYDYDLSLKLPHHKRGNPNSMLIMYLYKCANSMMDYKIPMSSLPLIQKLYYGFVDSTATVFTQCQYSKQLMLSSNL